MPSPEIAALHAWLEAHEQAMIADLVSLLRIPSIKEDPAPGAPYGRGNREALDFMLELGKSWGMRTADQDHRCGYAEFGEGDKLVVSLGHLDVVPVGPGWKHDPFGAEIDGDYIYARGAVDDKGPTLASFYAARALKACCPELGARIRVVFGCDEESGMTCVERYLETEEPPTFGIAPDSGWPLYHGEKGIADLFIAAQSQPASFRVVSGGGGQRLNIVPDACEVVVDVAPEALAHVKEKVADAWDRNVSLAWQNESRLEIRASGKAAHGSRPWSGDSAVARVFRCLYELAPLEAQPFFEDLLWMAHPGGVGLGIDGRDEATGDLTSNVGRLEVAPEGLLLAINIRYPATWPFESLLERHQNFLAKLKGGIFRLVDHHNSPPLYFPLDHPLVKTIVEVYREETGRMDEPGTMGGGTYARKIPNTVSIGTGWEGDGNAHETDERIKVANVLKMAKIYAHILFRLANLPVTSA